MCGIAGYLGEGNKEVLERMVDSLSHRGPDDRGTYLGERIGLGHRRLSIIDLVTGQQPISNEDGTIQLVFNGEIYNFNQLRGQLTEQGHKFKTKTDSEVIVHLYEEHSQRFLNYLNGMFAIALWDEKNKKLILARDRLGQKPLYYAFRNQTLIFGSEIKALLNHFLIKKELDLISLAKYLIYEYVPAPHSIFEGIKKLGPGEYLTYQDNKLKIAGYWDVGFQASSFRCYNPDADCRRLDYLQELDGQIERAVKKRLVADVPLGIFLSGGIDSTVIAYYAQKNSAKAIKTFSIGFKDKSFDESHFARQAAGFLETEHYEHTLEAKDCLDLIPQIADFLDEPLADASIVPTYLLSKFVRQEITVALAGDGGDELFMGYPTFQAHKLAGLYRYLPAFLRDDLIAPLINYLPASFNNISLDFALKRFISGAEYSPEIQNQIWLGSFVPGQIKNLLSEEAYRHIEQVDVFEDTKRYLAGLDNQKRQNRLIYLYLKNYLQDDILVKTDRASMAVGLEVRAPLLDHQLVDFVNAMPVSYKLRGWQTKYLLKELMSDKLPNEIVYRRKKGFGVPVGKWIKDELNDLVLSIFNEQRIKSEGIFNFGYINKLLKEHFFGRKDNRKLLWTLLVFEIWRQKWL